MNHNDTVSAILFIRPNAKFTLRQNELDWLDENQDKPTQDEINAGLVAYKKAEKDEAKAKEIAKAAILDRLGLTADELQTILG